MSIEKPEPDPHVPDMLPAPTAIVSSKLSEVMDPTLSTQDLLRRWLKRVREQSFAHWTSEEHYGSLQLYLGIPTIVLSTSVGTAVFVSLQKEATGTEKVAVGLISILAAIFAALQTFLRYSERADKHRVSGAKYGALRRELEGLLALTHDGKAIDAKTIDEVRERIDRISESAPNVSASIWKKAIKVLLVEDKR